MAIECKSFLDSTGVRAKNGKLQKENTYKLFNNGTKRRVILDALRNHLVTAGMCPNTVTVKLVLATGNIHEGSRAAVSEVAGTGGWELWSDHDIANDLLACTSNGYENCIATMTAKIISKHLATGAA